MIHLCCTKIFLTEAINSHRWIPIDSLQINEFKNLLIFFVIHSPFLFHSSHATLYLFLTCLLQVSLSWNSSVCSSMKSLIETWSILTHVRLPYTPAYTYFVLFRNNKAKTRTTAKKRKRKKLTQTRENCQLNFHHKVLASANYAIVFGNVPSMTSFSLHFFVAQFKQTVSDSWARDWLSVLHCWNAIHFSLPPVVLSSRRTFWLCKLFFVRIAFSFVQGEHFFFFFDLREST